MLDLTSDGMWQIARYLGFSGSHRAARDLFQLIADAQTDSDAYGPEHPDTLTARHSLARWTGRAGDPDGARDQLAALLPIFERVMGPEHPDTLATRDDLAGWTGMIKEAAPDAGRPRNLRTRHAADCLRKRGKSEWFTNSEQLFPVLTWFDVETRPTWARIGHTQNSLYRSGT